MALYRGTGLDTKGFEGRTRIREGKYKCTGGGKEAKHVYCVTGEKSPCGLAAYINFSLPDSC